MGLIFETGQRWGRLSPDQLIEKRAGLRPYAVAIEKRLHLRFTFSLHVSRLHCVLLLQCLNAVGHLWKRGPTVGVNIGGLAASVYLLFRTAALFKGAQE